MKNNLSFYVNGKLISTENIGFDQLVDDDSENFNLENLIEYWWIHEIEDSIAVPLSLDKSWEAVKLFCQNPMIDTIKIKIHNLMTVPGFEYSENYITLKKLND